MSSKKKNDQDGAIVDEMKLGSPKANQDVSN